jgi:hypothetical protein
MSLGRLEFKDEPFLKCDKCSHQSPRKLWRNRFCPLCGQESVSIDNILGFVEEFINRHYPEITWRPPSALKNALRKFFEPTQ